MIIEDQQQIDTGAAEISEDDALAAVWDEMDGDTEAGAERGEDGRFKGKDAQAQTDGDGGEVEAGEGEGEPKPDEGQQTSTVPIPPNWNGMDEDWKKIPADVQAKIAARDTELHARMSDQGRQIGTFKPFVDVLERHRDLLQGRTLNDGSPLTPTHAVDFLLQAQRALDADPVRTLFEIAEQYGASQKLAAVLTGQAHLPAAAAPQKAGVSPADVQSLVQRALTEDQQARQMNEEVSRLSQDKPLFAEIPEGDMVHAIHKARGKLGDAASNEAVFNLAYDIAVNADPDLRKKVAAPAAARAATPDPKRTADARRAASVNVSSTSTGKGRTLSEDEILAQAYDAASQKDR